MKPSLQVRLSQRLALTPQLQQSIRLLQLSTLELHQEIERALEENPLLERDEEPAPAPYPDGESVAASAEATDAPPAELEPLPLWSDEEDSDEPDRLSRTPDLPDLRRHLRAQLALLPLGERDRALADVLIEALDDDGYLTQSLEEIAALFPPEAEVSVQELSIALRHLQNLEPAGVGARSLGECLALQLRARHAAHRCAPLALALVERHLESLARHEIARLREATGADDAALRDAIALVRSLDPRPGAPYARLEPQLVVPDVIVRKVRGLWRASLNPEAVPRVRVNRLYAELAAARGSDRPLAGKLQEAKWLIRNVRQRFATILRVAQAIVDRQRGFFEHGEVAMRPLVLREIAEALGLHESTVSRVTTAKYMATPRGTFELKYFFGSHVATDAGTAASATAIRALLRQLIAAEPPQAPLSDAALARLLAEQGFRVARRTVAKYREAMHIPPAPQRRRL